MAIEVDISNDWEFIDGKETVTIVANDEPENEVIVEGCCSNEVSEQQMNGPMGMEPAVMQWSIPTKNMKGMILRNGYVIRQHDEEQTEWTVNSFNESSMGSRYKANTTRRI